jgi:hypothetical protein
MHHTGSLRFSAHGTPIQFQQWLTKYKGVMFIGELKLKANSTLKLMPFEKVELLHQLNKEIKELQNAKVIS